MGLSAVIKGFFFPKDFLISIGFISQMLKTINFLSLIYFLYELLNS